MMRKTYIKEQEQATRLADAVHFTFLVMTPTLFSIIHSVISLLSL
jgi:hypothetical protein